MTELEIAYEVLSNVYKKGAYSNIELNRALFGQQNPQKITKIVYGVLEKNTQLDYYLGKLCTKKPQNTIAILLKLGMFCITFMDSIPNYAVVDNCVELCNSINKYQLKGFVNSVLKKYCDATFELPTEKTERLSVQSSTPLWLTKELCKQYSFEKTQEFLLVEGRTQEHIRANGRISSFDQIKELLEDNSVAYELSPSGGFFVNNNNFVKSLFEKGLITIQGMTSIECCKMADIKNNDKVLDICAAPGGKSILINEMAESVEVIACDIHPHRVELIDSYIKRMKAENIATMCHDALIFKPEWQGFFDKVLCDVPCSGFGVASKKPDIYLFTTMKEVEELSKLQYSILTNSAKYVASGGSLIYSTCTLLRQENYNVVGKFVKENTEWQIEKHCQYVPNKDGYDGFFVAVLKRK